MSRAFNTTSSRESIGIVLTVFVVDRFYTFRDSESLKHRLKGEVRSRSHDIAISAVEWMDREGWLRGEDGLLQGADLIKAELQDARLNGASLEGANMQSANVSGAGLENANMRDARLVFANAKGAVMHGARLEHAALNSADMDDAYLNNAQLDNATLSHAKLRSAKLDYTSFRFAKMHNADLTDAFTLRTNYFKANLHSAKLHDLTEISSNNFEGATLTCVDLRGVDLENGHLQGADLRMADLSFANLIGANLRGANLYGVLLEGADVLLYDTIARLHHGDGDETDSSRYTEFWQRGTDLSDAVLPDGTSFPNDLDYEALDRFTDEEHPEFERTLGIVEAIREAEADGIDWEMTIAEFGV